MDENLAAALMVVFSLVAIAAMKPSLTEEAVHLGGAVFANADGIVQEKLVELGLREGKGGGVIPFKYDSTPQTDNPRELLERIDEKAFNLTDL